MITLSEISPTKQDTAICLGTKSLGRTYEHRTATGYAVYVALDGTPDTMLVYLPANQTISAKIKALGEVLLSSPVFMAELTFENLNIRYYKFHDEETNSIKSGYTATATDFTILR